MTDLYNVVIDKLTCDGRIVAFGTAKVGLD